MKKNNITADNFTSSKITLKNVLRASEFFIKINKTHINSLSISFVNDDEMSKMNEKYLSHEGSTDIITFDYTEDEKEGIDGEIIICADEAKRQSRIHGVLFGQEIMRLVFHGFLHLTGYDDTDSKNRKIMKSKEDETLTLWNQYNLGKSNNFGAN